MAIKAMDWSYIGLRTRVYRNLLNGRISVQIKSGSTWRVMGHVLDVVLQDVTFRVSESGRQRVIKERCKNVHAWGEGILIGEFVPGITTPIDLAYNPYENETFIQRGTSNSILRCNFLVVRQNQVFVTPDAVGDAGDQPRLSVVSGRQLELLAASNSLIDIRFAA